MTHLDEIKCKLNELYHTQPNIHINVSISHPKVSLQNEAVVIKGIYSHIFQIEEFSSGFPKRRTIQYNDILTKNIEIVELNNQC